MKLPSVLTVGGINYQIIEDDSRHLNDVNAYGVLVHELVHAILFEAGLKEKASDEEFVQTVTNILFQVLRDNNFNFIYKI